MQEQQAKGINTIFNREGHSRNQLMLEIDGLQMRIDFRNGGQLESPVTYSATSHAGIGAKGLFEEWRCKGSVTVSASLYDYLMQVYRKGISPSVRGATHQAVAAVDGSVMQSHVFGHVLLKSPPKIAVNSFGDAQVLIELDFGLNDLLTLE